MRYERARWSRKAARVALLGVIVLWVFALSGLARAGDMPPRAAVVWRAELTRNARYVFGLDAPVALFGAQIEQESAWRPDARSAYAGGLAQFTPSTAEWISGVYKLGSAEPFNPSWALRALVVYDAHLLGQNAAATDCDRWAFALAAYNGGQGWINRDRRLAVANGAAGDHWFGAVELYTSRSAAARVENRAYPRRILLKLQPRYASWGGTILCAGIQ